MGYDMRSRTVRRVRMYGAIGTAITLVGGLGFTQIAGAAPSATSALANSRPSFVAGARDLGAVRASEPVDFEVLLSLPNESAVEAEVQARVHSGQLVVPQVPDAGPVPLPVLAVGRFRRRRRVVGPPRRSQGGIGGAQPPLRRSDGNHGSGRIAGRHLPSHLRLSGPGPRRTGGQLQHSGQPERRRGRRGESR